MPVLRVRGADIVLRRFEGAGCDASRISPPLSPGYVGVVRLEGCGRGTDEGDVEERDMRAGM